MTPLVADRRLKNMTAWDCAPCLTQDDINMLLVACARADDDGNEPPDTGWKPTYDLDWAAREAWAWKAGYVADRFSMTVEGTVLTRAQVYDHCVRMYNLYDKKAVGRPHSLRSVGNMVEDRGTFNPTPWWMDQSA